MIAYRGFVKTDETGPPSRALAVMPRSPRGWLQFGRAVWDETSADQVPLLAAGVAFFAFVSIFPALLATGLVYGLVADPEVVSRQIETISDVLPEGAREVVVTQLQLVARTSQRSLGFGLVVALALALWGASTATSNLISAVNASYDHTLRRGFVRRRALALLMTLGAIVFVSVAVGLIAVLPVVVEALSLPSWAMSLIAVGRWVGLLLGVIIALAVLYRFAPYRAGTGFEWVSVGAVVAMVLWIAASAGFSLYVDRLATYGSTYGQLAGVIVLLLWLWFGALAALLGAEVNAEVERRRSVGREVAAATSGSRSRD